MWLQAHLTVDKSSAPLIALLFEDLGALAVTFDDAGHEPMLEPGPGETPLWQATRVSGLFGGDTDPDDLRSQVSRALAGDANLDLTLEPLADRDWERAWMDRFKPMRFGRRLWIRPSGSAIAEPDAVVIDLDPGLAFGTGTHPTTALCLEWLDGQDLAGKQVIDFGCGSGVLAIAALKLGAHHATAVDHDPQAVLATRDNAERNRVGDRISVVHSTDFAPQAVDLVMANILANVLVDLAQQIQSMIRTNGRLLLSGILREQADAVMQAYAGHMDFDPIESKEDWVLLAGTKHP